jgi:hypothetical protein
MPILRNYELFSRYSRTFQKEMDYLVGNVYNDVRFPDGTEIRTSAVLEITDGYAKTNHTEYILE